MSPKWSSGRKKNDTYKNNCREIINSSTREEKKLSFGEGEFSIRLVLS